MAASCCSPDTATTPNAPMAAPATDGPYALTAAEGWQQYTITVKGGFTPTQIALQEGIPARLLFARAEHSACTDMHTGSLVVA